MNSDEMPDEQGRIRRGIEPLEPIGGGGLEPTINPMSTTKTKTKTEYPGVIWVCGDCLDYFEYDDEWVHCPKCGEELSEVDKA